MSTLAELVELGVGGRPTYADTRNRRPGRAMDTLRAVLTTITIPANVNCCAALVELDEQHGGLPVLGRLRAPVVTGAGRPATLPTRPRES